MLLEGDWCQDGYVIARAVFSPERVAQLRRIAESCITQWKSCNPEDGRRKDPNTQHNQTCMRHLNHPGYFPPGSLEFTALMESIADPALLALVEESLGMKPLFRSTSLFVNPELESTWGIWHRDQQFLIPDEADERQFLEEQVASGLTHAHGCQMQIALVPNSDIELVRGSHLRWDLPSEYAVRCAEGRKHNTQEMPGALRIGLEPGDAVLFNSNGFHRGRYHVDKPRYVSQVEFCLMVL
jgi:ectoine hydroxylase-related dioxygenase (phytanoyl-CoA dioxygenase family)